MTNNNEEKPKRNIFLSIVIILFILTSLIAPLIAYFNVGKYFSLPPEKTEWNSFSQYIGGIIGPIISFWTLVITAWIAITFNNYQKKQKAKSDSEELQQTTIDLFKEIRSPEMRKTRDIAREVKKYWDNDKDKKSNTYQARFIYAMINEEEFKDDNIKIEQKHYKAVYDLFTFYIMLGLYSNNEKNIKNLNYFYYSWWRRFLHEIATEYDKNKITIISNDPILLQKEKFDKNVFLENISLKRPLKKLDLLCGFDNIDENFELHI